jgi:hypothetical protein
MICGLEVLGYSGLAYHTVTKICRVRIPTPTGNLMIDEVYHVPGVDRIIFLTGQLIANGWKLSYQGTKATLLDSFNNSYSTIFHNYCWSLGTINDSLKVTKATVLSFDSYKWHVRLGHALEEAVKLYLKMNYPEMKVKWKSFFCDWCAKSKNTCQKSLGVESKVPWKKPLDMMVTDVAGSFETNVHGMRYVSITLRDHSSLFSFVGSTERKADVPNKIMSWLKHIKNYLDRYPTYIWCDNALETPEGNWSKDCS